MIRSFVDDNHRWKGKMGIHFSFTDLNNSEHSFDNDSLLLSSQLSTLREHEGAGIA
jgi:hypothetical protein